MHSPRKFYGSLYFYVLLAIFLGVAVGYLNPELAVQFKPLGDGFIKLIKMLIVPIIFTTVVVGIANIGDMQKEQSIFDPTPPHRQWWILPYSDCPAVSIRTARTSPTAWSPFPGEGLSGGWS